jgi:PAS domain S-box-containing protein
VSGDPPDREGGGFDPGFDVYRALVEGIPAVLYIDYLDEWSTNWFTSPQSVEMFGYTAEEWGTTPDLWLKKIHPDDVDRVKAENDRGNETGEPFFSEYRMYTADGRIVWIRDEAWLSRSGGRPHWRGVMLDITAQKEAEEKLRWSLDVLRRTIQQRRELAVRLEGAQEEERRRIATDIHDDPIQAMSAVDLRLSMLAEKGLPADPLLLAELQGIVRRSIERMRSLLFELRPSALDREGLIQALRQYLEHAARDTEWSYELTDDLASEPGPELRATLYRIAQEAITNARKHAAASSLQLWVATEGDGVMVRIRDDGEGFDTGHLEAPTPGHIGLATMIERAELMGGWCRVTSHLGSGTTVECWLPADDADGLDLRPGRSA